MKKISIVLAIILALSGFSFVSCGKKYTVTFIDDNLVYFTLHTDDSGKQYERKRIHASSECFQGGVYHYKEYSNIYTTVKSDRNGYVTPPKDPEGYFVGWYKEPECVNLFDFSTDIVHSDITLYAKVIATEICHRCHN